MIINPYLVQPSGPSYGTLTTAWIAATGETDLTILGALNTLETDMATYGLTAKMKALWPFCGGTAAKHKYNFMDAQDTDAAFRLVFNGGWTHSSNGALPNGTNAYANTKYNPNVSGSLNDEHLSYYSRTNSNGTEVEIGAQSGSAASLLEIRTSGTTYSIINGATYMTYLDANSLGFYKANRTASNVTNAWKNGTKLVASSNASSTLVNNEIYLGAYNNGGTLSYYSTKQCALASIGLGLSDSEAANFYTAVQAFQTTLSRNV